MRVRISHFETKQIEVTKQTRPTPKIVRATIENTSDNVSAVGHRERLAKKLGLKELAVKLGLQIISNTDNKRKETKNQSSNRPDYKKLPKLKTETQLATIEAKYAAKPVAKSSKQLESLIRLEAEVFRNLKHGKSEGETVYPAGGRQNFDAAHQFQKGFFFEKNPRL